MTTDAKQEEIPKPPETTKAADEPPKHDAAKTAGKQPDKDSSNDPPKAESGRSRLRSILRFAMLGFAPLIAIIALAVAGYAVSANRVSQAQLGSTTLQLKNLNAALATSKTEIANLKNLVANLGAKQEKEKKNQEVLTQQIVQGVSKLQAKAKIKPTLEEQLQQPASSPAATPPAASVKAITSVAETESPKKNKSQVQAIKEAIEVFNKNESRKR